MTLPIALVGTDLIGQARTGTGKTLAFGIPILQRIVAPGDPDYLELVAPGKPQALVVAPTRELALQVSGDLAVAGSLRKTRTLTVYGGVGYDVQLDALAAGVDIVVGTPGRLLDLADRRSLDLSHVKVLVLDEADEMLDLGFLPDVERILRHTSELRQTMLFSATMPGAVVSLARTHMRHPVNIRAESPSESQTVPATAQFVYRAHDLDKPEIIARILQAESCGSPSCSPGPSGRLSASPTTSPSGGSPPHLCTGTCSRCHGRRRCGVSARARSTSWWPPTSPPAGSTWRG
jgi:superfamily II DNA/RNA helicase